MNIVLLEPEIPQNTGNIVRSAAATGVCVHLIRPLGFSLDDKYLKRAGLDYWDKAIVKVYENLDDFWQKNQNANCYYASTKAKRTHADVAYTWNDYLFFGKETAGLPESLLKEHYDRAIRIPMKKGNRSLNLSNAVAIVLYEGLRQLGFPDMEGEGELSR